MIRSKDLESADAARKNTEWLNKLGNNTKLVRPWCGIVVHRTPTEDFDLEGAKAQAIEQITEENELTEQGYQIKGVAWLNKLNCWETSRRWVSDSTRPREQNGLWTMAATPQGLLI